MTAAAQDTTLLGKVSGRAARFRAFVRSRESWVVVIAVGVGCVAGALVTLMSRISQVAHVLIFGIPLDERLSAAATVTPLAALGAPLAGGLALGAMEWWRRHRNIPHAVDPVEANALRGGRMSLRDSLIVSAQTLISNGCGASVGLEAGYSQIGAGLASRLGVTLRLRRNDLRILVGCGAAGAIAAAFGAPLTGAFYAFELIIGFYSVGTAAAVAGASVAAVLTTQVMGGAPYSIHVDAAAPTMIRHYFAILVLGMLVSGLGVAVMRLVALVEKGFDVVPFWLRPASGGLMIGGLALITPQVLAAGHGAMLLDLPLDMPMKALALLIVLKLAATMISLGSGFRGGLFFASLFVGSLAGKLFERGVSLIWPSLGLDAVACALAGMGVLAVAIVGGPLTMAFLVLETTGDFGLTGAVLTACLAASLFVRETFGYSFSTWRLHLRGETVRSANDVGWMRNLTVGRLMRGDPRTIRASATLADFRQRYPLGSGSTVVALDHLGRYAGLALTAEAFAAHHDPETTYVGAILRAPLTVLTVDMNVKDAMALFDRSEMETLAVIDTDRQVLGTLTEAYAIRRYAAELDQANRGIVGG